MTDRADRILPPRLDAGTSKKNLQQIAVTGASQIDAVDAQIQRHSWIRIFTTVDVAFYFRSDNAGSVDQTLTTDQASSSATVGYQMKANTYQDFELGGLDDFIVHQGTGAGFIQLLGVGPPRSTAPLP